MEEKVRNLAKEMATRKTRESPPPEQVAPAVEGLTSYEELVGEYKTCIVKTTSGKAFEVKGIFPGDLLLLLGSPLLDVLSSIGVDVQDGASASAAVEEMTLSEKMDMITDSNFVELAREAVCAGVLSVNFVIKSQAKCDASKREVSIQVLPIQDVLDLYRAIMQLTVSEEDSQLIELFQEPSEAEGSEGEPDSRAYDSEELRAEAMPDTVPAS